MAFEITVPRLGWSMEEGIFVGWLKMDGEPVNAGEPLFTLESDKAAQEVEATESGILRIAPGGPEPGGTVLVGALLGHLVAEGEVVSAPALPIENPKPEPEPMRADKIAAVAAPTIAPDAVTISPRAARTAAALGVDWTKLRGTGRSGRIRERDVFAAASGLDPDDPRAA